jgi:quinol monooxygenase YgiN
MIHVIAMITAQPGQRSKLLEAFKALSPAVRAEEGCIEYSAAIDVQNAQALPDSIGPDAFVAIEKWANLAALRAHSVAPHVQAFEAQAKGLIAIRTIHVLEPIDAD